MTAFVLSSELFGGGDKVGNQLIEL